MSLLQPWVMWALPMLALPVLIHLIHRRRHRVVEWGAMMFLLDGNRLSRGRQRLREILLLVARTLAVAGLLFALGRPIAGGWIGQMAGERIDTVVLIVDRSASMGEHLMNRTESKLENGLRQVVAALEIAQPGDIVVIDAVTPERMVRITQAEEIGDLTIGVATDASSDIVSAFETAATYLKESTAGRAEVWVLSDAQESDWRPQDGRWAALSDVLANAPAGVRVRVTANTDVDTENLSVRVERARREIVAEGAELVLDIVVTRAAAAESSGDTAIQVPVAVEVGGARSSVAVELIGPEARLQGHRVPIDARSEMGFGSVALTADGRPGDDRFWFVYGGSAQLETLIVTERRDLAQVVSIAATTPTDSAWEYSARTIDVERAETLDLTGVSLLVWQAPLPEGDALAAIEQFVASSGVVLYLPPERAMGRRIDGLGWGAWREPGTGGAPGYAATWRSDDDLLRSGDDGIPLPVGEIELRRVCSIEDAGDGTRARLTLASLETGDADFRGAGAQQGSGDALLVRASTPRGGVYFLGALPTPDSTNMASEGLVLMALVHRALQSVSGERGSEAQRETGTTPRRYADEWTTPEGGAIGQHPLFERNLYAGVLTDGDQFVAFNRSIAEDGATLQPLSTLSELLGSVDVVLSADAGGSEELDEGGGLIEEIWRVFFFLVLIALVGESLLCASEGNPKSDQTPTGARP